MRRLININILLMTLFSLLGTLSLLRIMKSELYIVSIIGLSLLMVLAYRYNNFMLYIVNLITTYILICLSWPLASHFANLVRGDVYHYYPFTRYIYELGTFNEASEKIFGVYVPYWPSWHIELTILARVLNMNIFYISQIGQVLTTVLLTPLLALLISKLFSKEYLEIKYVAPLAFCFISFIVFTNTNPVPRSFAYILTFLALYLALQIYFRKCPSTFVLLTLVLVTIVFTHPYNATITPLIILTFTLLVIVLSKFVNINIFTSKNLVTKGPISLNNLIYVGIVSLALNLLWIVYNTWGIARKLANYVWRLYSMVWAKWEFEEKYGSWLGTTKIEQAFFKVHPLEPLIEKLVWATDILVVFLAVVGWFIIMFKLIKKRYVGKGLILSALMILAIFFLFLLDYMVIAGYPGRAFICSLPLIALFTSISIEVIPRRIVRKVVTCTLIMLYILTAALGFGTRTYQASYIWSSEISFEDKGMPTTHAIPVMNFVNKYGEFNSYDHVVADDSMARVLIKDIKYYVKYVEEHRRFPEKPTLLLGSNTHSTIAIIMRNFKPCYWTLRRITWGLVGIENIKQLLFGLKQQANSMNLVYSNKATYIYFKP